MAHSVPAMPDAKQDAPPRYPKLCVLIAYPYFARYVHEFLAQQEHGSYELMVDSGAFTAMNKGTTIRVEDYGAFLHSIRDLNPFHAVQLDVIGDPAGTRKNLDHMLAAGHQVMPVFTRGDSLARLDELYRDHDYVLLGGVAAGANRKNYLAWLMNRNQGRRIHWLGFGQMPYAKHYQPYSMDSSSLTGGLRFGGMHLYAGGGKLVAFSKADFLKRPTAKITRLAHATGLNAEHLTALSNQDRWVGGCQWASDDPLAMPVRGVGAWCTFLSYVQMALDCQARIGTRFYMAINGMIHIRALFRAYAFLKAAKKIPQIAPSRHA